MPGRFVLRTTLFLLLQNRNNPRLDLFILVIGYFIFIIFLNISLWLGGCRTFSLRVPGFQDKYPLTIMKLSL